MSDIISHPSLQPVLRTSAETLAQCQLLLDAINPSTQSPPSSSSSHPISPLQKHIFALLAQLRALNRDAIFQIRTTKTTTADARAEIDRLHLHLQNLYYEQRHLNSEIAACENYEHSYRQLPLIPLEEFLEVRPEYKEGGGKEGEDLMVARIKHEHAEREALEQQRQELLKKKQALIAENKRRKEDLANLDNDLERFIDAAKPIQKTFEKEY